MKKIYFVSGLGANTKVFERLLLKNFDKHFIEWKIPLENEKIEDYAKRMCEGIDPKEEVYLIGLSFGGIMVQEMSKYLNASKIVLISSVKKRSELPIIYRLSSLLHLHKFIPRFLFHNEKILSTFLLGKYRRDALSLVNKYMTVKNTDYTKWAIDKVVNWKGSKTNAKLLHLIGTRDGVFPKYYIKNAEYIDGGTHLMIHTKSVLISKKINEFLEN